jgi:hypothetical protein
MDLFWYNEERSGFGLSLRRRLGKLYGSSGREGGRREGKWLEKAAALGSMEI